MKQRLVGQETEYAIRFTPDPAFPHPGNYRIFQAYKGAIEKIVKTRPGTRKVLIDQFFVENGGSFNYERLPFAHDAGLIEGGSPECASAAEFVLYQRAQEKLLQKATVRVNRELAATGYRGDVGLIKNCRDADGNTYGAQENYEAVLATGVGLWVYRLGLVLLAPFMVLTTLVYYILMLAVAVVLMSVSIAVALISVASLGRLGGRATEFLETEKFLLVCYSLEYYLTFPLWYVGLAPYLLLFRLCCFRRQRKAMLGFLASRPIISGAGSLQPDGSFEFSEKALAITSLCRLTVSHRDRAIFDAGHLCKNLMLATFGLTIFRPGAFARLFSAKQRLQLGFSDSNRAQFAEYLKVGCTAIVLDMAEQNFLGDAPVLNNPIQALKRINTDATLRQPIRCRSGEFSPLDLQRYYCRKAKEFIRTQKDVPIEYGEIVRLWAQCLDYLENDPSALIGRLDWVTKKYLLGATDTNMSFASKKKIDIGYHELGCGYFDDLENRGLAPKIFANDQIEAAVHEPSSPTRVKLRSRLIKSIAFQGTPMTISWNSVKIGPMFSAKIIKLDHARKRNMAKSAET